MNKEKETAILHITDLHIYDPKYPNGNSNRTDNEGYVEELVNQLKKEYVIKYLVVSGDITDSGLDSQYQRAEAILNTLCNEFEVHKNNVLIIPGNHDIDWRMFQERCRQSDIDEGKVWERQEDKLKEFKEFYDRFFSGYKKFDANRVVCDKIRVEEGSILFAGINSLYGESFLRSDHVGKVNATRLRQELNNEEFTNNTVFLVFHHVNKQMENGDRQAVDNWSEIEPIIRGKRIRRFLFGHRHDSSGQRHEYGGEDYYDIVTGSFGIVEKDVDNDALVLAIPDSEEKQVVRPIIYRWNDSATGSGFWQLLSNKRDVVSMIPIDDHFGEEALTESIQRIESQDEEAVERSERYHLNDGNEYLSGIHNIEENNEITDELRKRVDDIIRENGLYISGHFHWSKNGKSHSFIKTDYFFENHKAFELAKLCFEQMMEKRKERVDLMIGYAMQGHAMGSILAIKHGIPYTYFPAFERQYSKYEIMLPEADPRTVIIVMDLLYTSTLLHWFGKKDNEIKLRYPNLNKVFIYTLFSTLNKEEEEEAKRINGIEFDINAFQRIQINKCTLDINRCDIWRKHLDVVHVLYSDK